MPTPTQNKIEQLRSEIIKATDLYREINEYQRNNILTARATIYISDALILLRDSRSKLQDAIGELK